MNPTNIISNVYLTEVVYILFPFGHYLGVLFCQNEVYGVTKVFALEITLGRI